MIDSLVSTITQYINAFFIGIKYPKPESKPLAQ